MQHPEYLYHYTTLDFVPKILGRWLPDADAKQPSQAQAILEGAPR